MMREASKYIDGFLHFNKEKNQWVLDADPNIMALFERLFPKAKCFYEKMQHTHRPRFLHDSDLNRKDINWFIKRFNLSIENNDLKLLSQGEARYDRKINAAKQMYLSKKSKVKLDFVLPLREYQKKAVDLCLHNGFLLCADQVGLGKSVVGIAVGSKHTPCLCVCEPHLVNQWVDEIKKFMPQAKVFPIYSWKDIKKLPAADFYIDAYSRVYKGHDYYKTVGLRSIVLDEVQSLRRHSTRKYETVKSIADDCVCKIGLSATPIMNYGIEIYNIYRILSEDSLGDFNEFLREWCDWGHIKDAEGFGTFLRKNFMILRRTRKDVARELPDVERTIYNVNADMATLEQFNQEAEALAMKVITGGFEQSGAAAREFDYKLRHATGVAKAKAVAEVVKMILDSEEKVVLWGWHRDVYSIWLEELQEYKPVMYTGTESIKQKLESKDKFVNGDARVFIMSLRSGSGLNGLQEVSSYAIFGELDWSAGIIDQCIGRLWREGQKDKVTALFITIDDGCDPIMKKVIGKKSIEAKKIIELEKDNIMSYQQEKSKISSLAKEWLKKKGHDVDKIIEDKEKEQRGELIIEPPKFNTKEGEIFYLLKSTIYNISDELETQDHIERLFQERNIDYQREYVLSDRSRVDFRLGDMLIECKAGSFNKKSLLRQIKRYIADYPETKTIIIITPDYINHFRLGDVKIYSVNIADNSLLIGGLS